uniref:Ribonuclease MRP protein subunit rmp1 n=1 Tax=Talaromyces marneffei PM1 TaxID=1077442 RepID=A0A093X9M5_TALMA
MTEKKKWGRCNLSYKKNLSFAHLLHIRFCINNLSYISHRKMDQSLLETLFSTVHLIYHRNKNQHGGTAWWKWLSILRRCLVKLVDGAGNEKKCMNISRYVHTRVIPRAYIAFSTVVADGQFSTLGTVLVAALAQTKRVILPLPLRLRRDLSVKQKKALSLPAQTHTNDMESDFGVPIRRAVEPSKEKEVVSMPNISEKKSSKRSSDAEDVATPPPAKDATTKVKKSKSKKKKSGNAIDDIFGALK